MPVGYRIELTMNMPGRARLLVNGYTSEPTAYLVPLSSGCRRVIEAAPAEVPWLAKVIATLLVHTTVVDGALGETLGVDE